MRCSQILNYYHVSLNRNCLQLFVFMSTDVSYEILNRKKCIIFMSLGKKQCVNYGVHCNLMHIINNSLPIEISLEKRSVQSIWSCVNSENYVVKTISRLPTKLPRSVFRQNYIDFSL